MLDKNKSSVYYYNIKKLNPRDLNNGLEQLSSLQNVMMRATFFCRIKKVLEQFQKYFPKLKFLKSKKDKSKHNRPKYFNQCLNLHEMPILLLIF